MKVPDAIGDSFLTIALAFIVMWAWFDPAAVGQWVAEFNAARTK